MPFCSCDIKNCKLVKPLEWMLNGDMRWEVEVGGSGFMYQFEQICQRSSNSTLGHLRGRVFKQPIIRVKHLLGEQEEPFSGHAPVVQAFLRFKLYPQTSLQTVGFLQGHDSSVRLLKDVIPVQLHLKTVRNICLWERDSNNSFILKFITFGWIKSQKSTVNSCVSVVWRTI